MSLGHDFGADALAAFDGELFDVTITRPASSEYDIDDPTGAPEEGDEADEHECQGIAFTYARNDVDGSRVMKDDFRAVILRATLDILPETGDIIEIPPPGETTPQTAVVVNVEAVTEAAITLQVRA